MKIGVVGPIWHNIPPKTYGGTEDVVYNLVNGLTNKGHDVTLFGPKTSKVYAKVHPTIDLPLREQGIDWTNIGYTLLHITEAFDQAALVQDTDEKFDLLHIHLNKVQDYFSLPLALLSKTPVLFTLHFKIPTVDENNLRSEKHIILEKYSALPFTSISDSQRKGINLNFIATVYNSVDLKRFPFSDKSGNYLVWLGKINPAKGTKDALLAAKQTGYRIYLMGMIENGVPEMLSYYENEIKPLIDDKQVIWLGEVSHLEKTSIMSGAKAFLNPIKWEEPFGLVMVESQAVGTPVISYRRGAAPELIIDGKTGFLVNSLDEMVEKITEVEHLDRKDCLANIEEKFTIDLMAAGYEKAYNTTIEHWEQYRSNQRKLLR